MKQLLSTIIFTLIAATLLFAQEPHDADTNGDFVISHEELLREVELWKAGAYHIDSNGNFVPGNENWNNTFTVNLPNLPADAKPLEMVLIEPGTFMMGSPSNEKGRYHDEQQHQVTITNPFYIGKYEVTQAQWQSVMGSNPSRKYGVGSNYPVYGVSWNDCQKFITKLNQTGQGTFRLPTEAEWEYACRAGTTERFYWGDDPYDSLINGYAWYRGNNPDEGTEGFGTKEVGTRLPNQWGLFDMSGNAFEWCQDWYGYYPTTPIVDPKGKYLGSERVVRGGIWGDKARDCRSAYRYSKYPSIDIVYYGFRLCRTP